MSLNMITENELTLELCPRYSRFYGRSPRELPTAVRMSRMANTLSAVDSSVKRFGRKFADLWLLIPEKAIASVCKSTSLSFWES
jgi:hypothetical protein